MRPSTDEFMKSVSYKTPFFGELTSKKFSISPKRQPILKSLLIPRNIVRHSLAFLEPSYRHYIGWRSWDRQRVPLYWVQGPITVPRSLWTIRTMRQLVGETTNKENKERRKQLFARSRNPLRRMYWCCGRRGMDEI